MIEIATQTVEIDRVTSIEPRDGAVALTFGRGLKVILPASHRDRELILYDAERSLQHVQPVGFLLDSVGQVLDLQYAIQTSVKRVTDCEDDPNRLEVGFWGYSPVCYVTRDHPDFERIRRTLEQALASGKRVWLATHTWPETSETEIWIKIMDIRPSDDPNDEGERQGPS